MIPKTIHYCWFGGNPKPKLAQKCIQSWIQCCPDYEIKEWNESNFDVYQNAYTKYCYENGKYAFLSDYARLKIVYDHGGFYFDTDVEIIRCIDDLCIHEAFFGFENDEYVNTGIGFGADKNSLVIKAMLEEYDQSMGENITVIKCPELNTRALVKCGLIRDGSLQIINGAVIYPEDYFNPYDDPTGKLNTTENTYSVHWYAKSWMPKTTVLRSTLTKPLHRIFGVDAFRKKGD